MTYSARQILLSAIFGAAFLAVDPVRADTPIPDRKDEVKKDEAKKDDDVKKQLDEIKKMIGDMKKDTDDILLGKSDGKFGIDLGLKRRVEDLEAKHLAILERLKNIEEKLKNTSTSLSPSSSSPMPSTTAPAPIASTSAKLRLVNDYAVEVTIVVNGRAFRLSPSEIKTVEVASGTYTYELLQADAASTTGTIKDGETVTLRIR